jgi:hypothetical protein
MSEERTAPVTTVDWIRLRHYLEARFPEQR